MCDHHPRTSGKERVLGRTVYRGEKGHEHPDSQGVNRSAETVRELKEEVVAVVLGICESSAKEGVQGVVHSRKLTRFGN